MKTSSTTSKRHSKSATRPLKRLLWLAASALLLPAPGLAYECSSANESNPSAHRPSLSWSTRNLPISFNRSGTEDIPGDEEFALLEESLRVWERARECLPPQRTTDVTFTTDFTDARSIGYHFKPDSPNHNLILFEDTQWPHPGGRDFIFGLTTTTHNLITGALLDADIELNTADFNFSTSPTPEQVDLASVMVHEVGHLLGLDHTPVPDAAMDAQYTPGQTNKRALHCDDQDGIGFKYPTGEANGYCEPTDPACHKCYGPRTLQKVPTLTITSHNPDSGGCQFTPLPPLPLIALLLLLLIRVRP